MGMLVRLLRSLLTLSFSFLARASLPLTLAVLLLAAAALLRIARRLATRGFDDERNHVLGFARRGLFSTLAALCALSTLDAGHRLHFARSGGRFGGGGSSSRSFAFAGGLRFRGLADRGPLAGGLGGRHFFGRRRLLELFAHVFGAKKNAP